jgi:hypothetical protein
LNLIRFTFSKASRSALPRSSAVTLTSMWLVAVRKTVTLNSVFSGLGGGCGLDFVHRFPA